MRHSWPFSSVVEADHRATGTQLTFVSFQTIRDVISHSWRSATSLMTRLRQRRLRLFAAQKLNHCTTFRWSQFLINLQEARESASFTSASNCQLGNATVGAAEPPTELAVDILHHHHIRVDVGFAVRVEVSGGELVQHGWAFHEDGG